MALTSIKISNKKRETLFSIKTKEGGEGRREISITCVWTIVLPLKLLNLVKFFVLDSAATGVKWRQRSRCHFTSLLRIHTVIFISGAGGCFQYRSHYLDVGFGNFPNRKQASIFASSELIVSPRFNKAITRDSQNTYISVHWHCNWRNISPCLMHNTMEFQYLPSMPRTSNYLIWT